MFEMESKPTSSTVMRRICPVGESFRYYPHDTGTGSGKEDVKQELVRLGVELSLYVAESMFLLCDDIHTMLWFCFKLWKYTIPPSEPVAERLLLVIHSVYSKDIKPKNRVYQDGGNSAQWGLIRTTWKDFTDGIIILRRLFFYLRRKEVSFDDRLLSSVIAIYKQQVLMKLEEKLKSARDVAEANGFAREAIESNVSHLWKSLFDDKAGEAGPEVIRDRIVGDLFQPILGKSWHNEIQTLAVYSPYILGPDFAKQGLREEAVQLGVELSFYVAESMFLLCDDIRSMLRFCLMLWRDYLKPASHVGEIMLRVIHYVYSRHIKPKNGVYQIGGLSVQCELISTTWENFDTGIRELDRFILFLGLEGSVLNGREFTSRIEEALKKLEEKLGCARDISETNGFGFAKEGLESNIRDLWRSSIFDGEEQLWTVRLIKDEIISDMFQPVLKEEEEAKQV